MIDFKYCLWFIPNANHEWNNIINEFGAHMTIKSKLEYNDAINEYNKISSNHKIKIRFTDDIKQDIDDKNKFYALLYNIKIDDNSVKPIWWPKDAHISFAYRYDRKFNKSEIDKIKKKIKIKYGILEKVILKKCSKHYSKWYTVL